jgi:large subunit ribosomal protein L29
MNATDMRALTPEDLTGKLTGWEEELFRARCSQAVGQLNQTHTIQVLRKDIARAKTLLNEKAADAASAK